jgi:uncharacterized protein YndB with AHSA1/START domain
MTSTSTSTDRIQKQVVMKAPRARVWRAISNAEAFGKWFGANLAGQGTFVPGARVQGPITYPGYEHLTLDITVDRVEPERLISFRWHPNDIDPKKDYSKEPMTLVVFELEEVPEGTRLTVVESGFDKIPIERRAEAYRGNEGGWAEQMERVKNYVDQTA